MRKAFKKSPYSKENMNNFRKYGNSPYNITLIHGGPGAPGDMAPVARELGKKWGVLEPLQTKNTLKGQINELKTILEEKGNYPIVLVGFSWGAWLCGLVASQYPDLVKKLILISSGPFEHQSSVNIQDTILNRLNVNEKEEVKKLFLDLNNPKIENKNYLFMRFGQIFSKADSFDPISYEPEIIEYSYDIYKNVWKEAFELRKSNRLLESIKKIKCPVVAIHGDYDSHPADGVKLPLSKLMLNFKFYLLKNCGHKPWIEKQAMDEFYKILKKEIS